MILNVFYVKIVLTKMGYLPGPVDPKNKNLKNKRTFQNVAPRTPVRPSEGSGVRQTPGKKKKGCFLFIRFDA